MSSSEIESIVTTTDLLFQHAQDTANHADPATKEELRYRTALSQGFQSLAERPLSTNTAVEICRTLKGAKLDIRRTPGTQLANDWTGEAIYPFVDGNGRVGRVINTLFLFLIQEGLLNLPILYLSRYIIAQRADYYRLLLEVTTQQAWEPWLLFMLSAVEETARWTTTKIAAIRGLSEHTTQFVRDQLPQTYSRELVDVIFEQPYCRISNVVDKKVAQRQAASRHLKDLVTIGVLEEIQVGKEKLFIHPKLMQLLSRASNEFKRYFS
ncbi:hypothetical protein PMI35_02713 [Pseudomonas sp. GM78]|uniref:Fic family protein n=1 Tax=Pseudomonas sp. GM78 TaxID=1144337 RepID=UPI000270D077|nr:Fic/DOC family N-terminal domain-containing protein [Pseudomonas sp. GM78]EJN29206.1 hypothetical protein PMI35_02713 [Pseudomonas sp. GM78]